MWQEKSSVKNLDVREREWTFLFNCQSAKAHEDCIYHISAVWRIFIWKTATVYILFICNTHVSSYGHFFYSGKIKQHTSRSFLNFQLLTYCRTSSSNLYNPVMNKVKEAVRQMWTFVYYVAVRWIEQQPAFTMDTTRRPEQFKKTSLRFIVFLRVKRKVDVRLWRIEWG